MTNEYKEALEFLETDFKGLVKQSFSFNGEIAKTADGETEFYRAKDIQPFDAHRETIRRALLIADKVMGEPSAGMLEAAHEYIVQEDENGRVAESADVFKAMRDQLIAEIE